MTNKPISTPSFAVFMIVFAVATANMGVMLIPHMLHAEDSPSLYARLGGKEAITAVVDEFVNRLVSDPKVNGRFGSTDVKKFKRLNVELVCMATGGPCQYSGQDMKKTHVGMRISQKEFDIVAGHLASTLRKFKVPKQEHNELLGIIGSLKKDIVERS